MSSARSPTGKVRPTCKSQLVSSGLGHHFVSPQKPQDKKKTQTLIKLPGAQAKWRHLLTLMEELMHPERQASNSSATPTDRAIEDLPLPKYDFITDDVGMSISELELQADFTIGDTQSKHHILPDKSTNTLYSSWSTLIPTLVEAQVKYYA